MWNRKKIKFLQEELKKESEINTRLCSSLREIQNDIFLTKKSIQDIHNKIEPKPIPTYDVDCKKLAEELSKCAKHYIGCHSGRCNTGKGYYYLVPNTIINNILKQ